MIEAVNASFTIFNVLSGTVMYSKSGYSKVAAFIDFSGKMLYNRVQISAFMKGF